MIGRPIVDREVVAVARPVRRHPVPSAPAQHLTLRFQWDSLRRDDHLVARDVDDGGSPTESMAA